MKTTIIHIDLNEDGINLVQEFEDDLYDVYFENAGKIYYNQLIVPLEERPSIFIEKYITIDEHFQITYDELVKAVPINKLQKYKSLISNNA